VALSFFSPAEIADMSSVSPEARRNYFYSCWTLKEAYLKARGVGLSMPADGFSFDLHGREPQICFTAKYFDNPQLWRFYQATPTPHHKLAVAVSGCAKTVDFRQRWVLTLSTRNEVP
jgi:4'-phosphopantetheinyl transferase